MENFTEIMSEWNEYLNQHPEVKKYWDDYMNSFAEEVKRTYTIDGKLESETYTFNFLRDG